MKMKLRNMVVGATTAIMLISSCKSGFTEINTDPNNAPIALPEQLLAPALVNTLGTNMLRNRNFNNELMQVTVSLDDAEGRVFRYDVRPNWADNTWNGWYSQLMNFKDLYKTAADPVNDNRSYRAISLICQTWIFSMLTDTYGNVPFTEAGRAKDDLIYEPKFDSQKDIYNGMFAMLEEANTMLSGIGTAAPPAIVASSDPVFAGNLARWRRFGNSLYLRLLMRVSGKAEVATDVVNKLKEVVGNINTTTDAYPKMASIDDSAILKWTGVAPYLSPYINGVRTQDWTAPAICEFFINPLLSWNDPRLDITTYGSGGINRWAIAQGSGGFGGVPSGYVAGTPITKQSYFYSTTSARSLQSDPLTGMMMNFAELQFIYAEASLKGWITNSTAATFYKDAVANSIRQWVPAWPATNVDSYLTGADMEWVEGETFGEKMEKIHKQKYYALFLTDFQQWFEYRRTGYPALPKGAGLRNNGVMPARLNYPVYVQSTNPTNYKKSVAEQGADLISTQVWWQKP